MNRLSILALFILAVGLGAGATLYLTADEPPPTAYIIVGDTAYAYDPATSRAYVRQLERFGGKSAVLFDDLNRWFASLWVGKALGITVACLSAGAALVLFWMAKARSGGSS